MAGIVKFYSDFVDIEGDWTALFAASSTLDLAIMYGTTWRNTHRTRLQILAERPDGRLRLVLPDPSPESPAVGLYAQMLSTAPEEFRQKIIEAVSDLQPISPRRHIEIYLTKSVSDTRPTCSPTKQSSPCMLYAASVSRRQRFWFPTEHCSPSCGWTPTACLTAVTASLRKAS